MQKLLTNKKGNVNMILMAVVAAIVIAISVVIVFSVMGGFSTTAIDNQLATNVGREAANRSSYTPAGNATDALTTNMETFYTISPIYIVVLAAVGIIAAIMMIVIKR